MKTLWRIYYWLVRQLPRRKQRVLCLVPNFSAPHNRCERPVGHRGPHYKDLGVGDNGLQHELIWTSTASRCRPKPGQSYPGGKT